MAIFEPEVFDYTCGTIDVCFRYLAEAIEHVVRLAAPSFWPIRSLQ